MRGTEITISGKDAHLRGELSLSDEVSGLVVFAHGSGSSRHSPRNQFVARSLREAGLGTLLLDLLTPGEGAEDARTGRLRFDIGLLAGRVVAAVDQTTRDRRTASLAVPCLGASP